jgi:hypothetical protein
VVYAKSRHEHPLPARAPVQLRVAAPPLEAPPPSAAPDPRVAVGHVSAAALEVLWGLADAVPGASLRVDAAQGLELTAEAPAARAALDERRARLCWPAPARGRVIRCPLLAALPGGPALLALVEALEAARPRPSATAPARVALTSSDDGCVDLRLVDLGLRAQVEGTGPSARIVGVELVLGRAAFDPRRVGPDGFLVARLEPRAAVDAAIALVSALEAARAEGRATLDADALGVWRATWAPRATSAATASSRAIEPHLGWHAMPSVGAARRWALVLPLPRGRIADRGRELDRTGLEALLAMTRADVYFTPRRGVALLGLDDATRARAEAILEQTGLAGGAP